MEILVNLDRFSVIRKFIIVLGYFNFFSVHLVLAENGWLRICDLNSPSKHYEIEADKCPHGAWLSNPITSGCLCLNGLWAVGQSWCDEDYYILLGKGHCFNMEKQVQRLAYLGDPDDPFVPSNFITKRNGHTFKKFKDHTRTPYEYELNYYDHNMNKTILRLKPADPAESFLMEIMPISESFQIEDLPAPVCITPDSLSDDKETTLFVYKIREAIKSLQLTNSCPASTEFSQDSYKKMAVIKMQLGESLHVKSGVIKKSSDSCQNTCKTSSSSSRDTIIRHKRTVNSSADAGTVRVGQSDAERQRLVNEQTLRMIKTEVRFLLEQESAPRHNNTNWRLLQKAKEAFSKACPEVHVPKFLLNAMLRMFRVLFIHTRDFNPYGHFFEETPQNQRIANALDACTQEATNFTLTYKPVKINGTCVTEEYVIDATTNTKGTKSTCKCNEQLDFINLTYTKNVSYDKEPFNLTKMDFNLPANLSYVLIPPSEQFNGSNRDFPIETTWKIINFAHYYCAKFFRTIPADHSALLIKLESFFNSEIIYRWNHPGIRTNETWQMLYSAFNLQKFADAVDACVGSAKHISDYPEWIVRPTQETLERKKRSLDSQDISSGKAYCLQDPWDPVDKLGVKIDDECYEWNNL